MAKRKLPLIVERNLSEVHVARIGVEQGLKQKVLRDGSVSCKVGCSNCCLHPRHISPFEGFLLYRGLVERGRWTPQLKIRVAEHAKLTTQLALPVWFLSSIPCPVLDLATGKCMAYESRPMACRLSLSREPSDECHPHRFDRNFPFPQVDVREEMDAYLAVERRIHHAQGIKITLVTLSNSLLLASRVDSGEIDFDRINFELFLLSQG